ncbi:hypothetical protein RDWZM_003489 [Blomia tropicalis]|uniref:SWI/SNF complex subunit SMARCC2 n=1 Tax=Blomia tropicalis TaxID=40697 RepID=A0A9Q0MG65_BLOTA|nr:hypothetical protein RDWZM_003489 [Blomia tropicalis]
MANAQFKKRDGGPNVKFFESPETIQHFDAIVKWLQKNCKKSTAADPPTKQSLATLVVQLLQFQEEAFGKNVVKPPLTRLPMKCFMDFKVGGSLCRILESVFKFKTDQGLRRFDLQSPSRMDRNVEMFMGIEKFLLANKCIIEPNIYISPEVDKNLASKLRDIVKRHQGKNVESSDDATHIIHPPVPSTEEEYVRPVLKRDRNVLIHWLNTPDSYDNWITVDSDIDTEPAIEREGPFEVTANWLLDLDEYNEWMNEDDYEPEVDISGKPNTMRPKYTLEELLSEDRRDRKNSSTIMKSKRRRSPSPQTDKKRRNKATARSPAPVIANSNKKKLFKNDDDSEDLTKDMDDPSPEPNIQEVNLNRNSIGFRNKDNENAPIKGGTIMDLDNNEYDDKHNSNANSVEGKTSRSVSPNRFGNTNGTVNKYDKDDGQDDNVTEQANHIIIPSYASWFDYNCIHAVERRGLPEFFNGRNKSKTPEVYIAYRNFMIDTYRLNPTEYLTVTAVRRNIAGDVCAIMRVHAFLEQWGLVNYQVDADARPTPMGPPSTSHFHVYVDAPSGLQPLNPTRGQMNLSASQQIMNLPKENGIAKSDAPEKNGFGDNFGLKIDQYAKKNPYFKTKAAANLSREWTEQETLLLLEGLELYKDDWNKVCEHIGSRTQDECILHFLRLPIEDPYLDETNNVLGPLSYHPIPFSKTGNPIMSTVAFLASVVDPRIASSAAKAAMDEFAKIKEEVPAALVDAHVKNVEAAAANDGSVDPEAGLDMTGIAGTQKSVKSDAKKPDEKVADSKNDDEKTENEKDNVNGLDETGDIVKKEAVDESLNRKSEPMDVDKSKDDSVSDAVNNASEKSVVDQANKDTTNEDASQTVTNEKKESKEFAEKDKNIIKESQISVAAAAALGSAAVKAKHLAAVEERKIKSLVALLVETQMKKLEIKLRHFEELEIIMDKEKETLEYQRQQLMQERQQFHLEQLKAAEYRARHQAQMYYNSQQPVTQTQPQQQQQQPPSQQQQQPPPPPPTPVVNTTVPQSIQSQSTVPIVPQSPPPQPTAAAAVPIVSQQTVAPVSIVPTPQQTVVPIVAQTVAQPMQQQPAPVSVQQQTPQVPQPAPIAAPPQPPLAVAAPHSTPILNVPQSAPQSLPSQPTSVPIVAQTVVPVAAPVPVPVNPPAPMVSQTTVPQTVVPSSMPVAPSAPVPVPSQVQAPYLPTQVSNIQSQPQQQQPPPPTAAAVPSQPIPPIPEGNNPLVVATQPAISPQPPPTQQPMN